MIDANNVYNETRIHFQGLTVVIMTLLIATEYLWQSVDILRFSWSHSRFSSLVHDLSPNMTYPRIFIMRNTTVITSGAATVYSYETPVFSFKW